MNTAKILGAVILLALSSLSSSIYAEEYSVYQLGNRYLQSHDDFYLDNIQPILTKRCVGCHSCNSGPCQLNLTSYEGLLRGISKVNPHDRWRFREAVLKADLADHLSVGQWREMGFHSILNESGNAKENKDSILYLALEQGEKNHILDNESAREEGIRQESEEYECPVNPKEFEEYALAHPFGGMPLGCNGLDSQEVNLLKQWIIDGAKGPSVEARERNQRPLNGALVSANNSVLYHRWEAYLNRDGLEQQAVARYVYEHTYTLNIHFEDSPGEFYRIVRSKTPAPENVDLIVTEFASDRPDYKGRIYYRLEKLDRVIEMKKHALWDFKQAEIDAIEEIFFAKPWKLDEAPPYADNPFEWFHNIPIKARAAYIKKYAREIWHSVARGSICHSREASYIEPDYGWYLQLKPESDPTVMQPKLGLANYDLFYAPPAEGLARINRGEFDLEPNQYQQVFESALRELNPKGLGVEDIEEDFFYGLRHETSHEFHRSRDSAVPGYPKFIRVLSYADTERYYYRTVVHYRYYASAKEKGDAFTFAAYIRGYSENLFASLHADAKEREKLNKFYTDFWGRWFYSFNINIADGRPAKTPLDWSYEKIATELLFRAKGEGRDKMDLNNWPVDRSNYRIPEKIENLDQWENALRTLTGKEGEFPALIPNTLNIRLEGQHLYTLFADRGYSNNRVPWDPFQLGSRRSQYDRIFAMRGFSGAFPHVYIDLSFADAASFIKKIQEMDSVDDWVALDAQFGIDRVDAEFWPFTDWLHNWLSLNMGAEAGVLDIRNYDLRDEPY